MKMDWLKIMKVSYVTGCTGIMLIMLFLTFWPVHEKSKAEPDEQVVPVDVLRKVDPPVEIKTSDLAKDKMPVVERVLLALRAAESNDGRMMIGDGGRARGWLQQHPEFWQDGCEQLGVDWPYPESTNEWEMCRAVTIGFWQRYCPEALAEGDVETLIRRFRLPFAPYRHDNTKYYQRVLSVARERFGQDFLD